MCQGLEPLLNPRSIAVIGASDNPDSVGGRPLRYLRDYGYVGNVYPVNPNRSLVQGQPAYASIADLPEAVDLAVVAAPAATVVQTVRTCGQAGVKACAVLSSGFGELGEAGKEAEYQLAHLAREYGMRILGPNCQGVANLAAGSIAAFSSCFGDRTLSDGGIAIVSQSGAVAGMLAEVQHAHPTGIRYWVSTGNESDIDVPKLIGQVIKDPQVRVVEAYCEQLRDPHRLAIAARSGAKNGKSILLVKSATTQEGKKAAASHTGALAQQEEVVDAFLHQHGIVRADGIAEMSSLARVFTAGRRVTGRRVAIVSNSGGLGVMMADRCRSRGLHMASLDESTVKELRSHLPSFAAVGNPIDVTAQLLKDPGLLSHVLPALAHDTGVDFVLVGLGMVGKGYDVATIRESLVGAHDATDRLLAVAWIGGLEEAAAELTRNGIPTFSDDATCVDAVTRYVDHRIDVPEATVIQDPEPSAEEFPDSSAVEVSDSTVFMSEHASKQLMRHWGLPVARNIGAETAEEAVAAARSIGYPVVAKISSPGLNHKTEIGGVRPDLRTDEEIHKATEHLLSVAQTAGLNGSGGSVLVEEMITQGLEVAVGGTRNPDFGPTILIAAGGTEIEANADRQLCFPPLDSQTIVRALGKLRLHPLLQHLRGVGPLDVDALVRLVQRFAHAFNETPEVYEVDLNPVFVLPRGRGVLIADALAGTKEV